MKKIISLALVLTLCLGILTSCGGGVSGKYVSAADGKDYFNFMKENKVEACKLGVIMEGTYEVVEKSVNMTFYLEAFGAKVPMEESLAIRDDGALVENILDNEIVYVKSK